MKISKLRELQAKRKELEGSLIEVERELQEAVSRAEEYVSAQEAHDILAQWSDTNGIIPLPRFLPVIKTLVSLRPEPNVEGEYFYTWNDGRTQDWSVYVDKRYGELQLTYHGEDVGFKLSVEEAELVGSWLLGAADVANKIEVEK